MSYRINVRNCKFCPVSVDTASTYTLGTAVPLPDLDTVELTFTGASGELYGDGELVDKRSSITGAQLKLGIDKVSQAARAAMGGHTVDSNGILRVKTTDVAPKIAVYLETENTDNQKEAMWLLVGIAEPIGFTGKQKEANITYSTDSITINCVRRNKDKELFALGDSDNTTWATAKQTAFASSPDLS